MNTTKLKLISQAEVENGSVKGFPDVVAGDATVLKNAFVKPSLNIAEVMNANIDVLVTSLGNVDNTSDLDKPISKLTQTAIDDKTTVTVGGVAQANVAFTSDPQTQINNLAPKESPTLNNATLTGDTTIGSISNAEINALDGIQSNIQGQINGKANVIVSVGDGGTVEAVVPNADFMFISGNNAEIGVAIFLDVNSNEMFRTTAQQYTIYRRYSDFFIYEFTNGTTTLRVRTIPGVWIGKIRQVANFGTIYIFYI